MVREHLFDNLTAKRFNLHQPVLKGCRTKFIQYNRFKFVITRAKRWHSLFVTRVTLMFSTCVYACSFHTNHAAILLQLQTEIPRIKTINNKIEVFHEGIIVLNSVKFETRSIGQIESHLRKHVADNLFTCTAIISFNAVRTEAKKVSNNSKRILEFYYA